MIGAVGEGRKLTPSERSVTRSLTATSLELTFELSLSDLCQRRLEQYCSIEGGGPFRERLLLHRHPLLLARQHSHGHELERRSIARVVVNGERWKKGLA